MTFHFFVFYIHYIWEKDDFSQKYEKKSLFLYKEIEIQIRTLDQEKDNNIENYIICLQDDELFLFATFQIRSN